MSEWITQDLGILFSYKGYRIQDTYSKIHIKRFAVDKCAISNRLGAILTQLDHNFTFGYFRITDNFVDRLHSAYRSYNNIKIHHEIQRIREKY